MLRKTMPCIDYNMWCSLVDYIDKGLKNVLINTDMKDIPVLPSYPKHLAKFSKPSVIVQKIYGTVSNIGMGNVLGQYEDDLLQSYDAYGKEHSVIYQITIEGDNNYEASILTDAITTILSISTEDQDYSNSTRLPLKCFSDKSMDVIGHMHRYGNIEITPLSVDEDKDYAISIRATFSVIQAIIDTDQQLVDLRKPLKWVVKIKKEG